MPYTYELQVDSRNVNIPVLGDIGKHTGYMLITYDENHNVTNIQTVALFNDNGKIVFKDGNYDINIPLGADIIPPKIYQDGEWIDTNPQWAEENDYKSTPIPLSNDEALAIYNNIKKQTDLINKLGEMGLSLDYNPINQNCNSWTGFINSNFFPEQNIFELLNSGLTSPDEYQGKDYSFPYTKYSHDDDIFSALLDILGYLEENNLTLDDISISVTSSMFGYGITLNYGEETIVFSALIVNLPPIITLGQLYSTASDTTSPLVIDLDGDGVETIGTQAGVHFDHDSNGFAENTGWVGRDDGILVRDINGNGQIDDGTELFGNNSVLSNGQKAANGFEALKDLDSNNDGLFNNQDAAWNGVKIWKDNNQNGILDDGELLTLEQAGITSFDLDYQSQSNQDANGNEHKQTSTITKTDGTTSTVTDVWFEADHSNTVDKADVVIPDGIKNMPEVAGFGNVHSLQTAMALDASGQLKALIEQYAAESNIEARNALLDQIIYHWAGVQDKDPNGRDPSHTYGKVIDDCRKLEALEEFMGKDYLGTWCWGDRDPNPHGRAAPFILQAYDILKEYVGNSLLAQTHYKALLENIPLTYHAETGKWEADTSTLVATWAEAFATNSESTLTMMKEFAAVLKNFGANGELVIETIRSHTSTSGTEFDNALLMFGVWENSGTENDDALYGTESNDLLEGKGGNDNLFGNGGDDLLIGGAGNDYLVGGNGKDVYHFDIGFENDCIDNLQDETTANEDIIRFGEGITPDMVTLGRQGFDLILTVSYAPDEDGNIRPSDSVRVYSYFDKQGTSSATISAITFTDETSWDYNYISTHWNSVPDVNGGITNDGNNGDNYLTGTEANDILIGNGGEDNLYGYGGNDLIYGGKGDDYLDGGSGNDTYLYNQGDGLDTIFDYDNHDKISFGEGICFEDLSFSLVNYNYLKITIKGDETQGIIIQNYNAGLNYKIEDLYFYDGTIVHLSEIPLTYHQNDKDEILYLSDNGDTIYAKGGNDTITGGLSDDVIIGGKGWDIINGGYGNDTFIWNSGDGFDTIDNYGGENTIKFGPGINLSNLTFRVESTALVVLVNGDETQGMRIQNKAYLRYLKFADGTTIDMASAELTYQQTDAGENSLNFTDNKDVINGGGGEDTIFALGGNDIISGGKGNDSLYGGAGDDTYVWNIGDGLDTINDTEGSNIIQFGTGIALSNLTFEKSDFNMRIYVNGDRTQGFYFNQCQPHTLKFADGTVYQMNEQGLIIHNSDNNDNTSGTALNDIIFGNGGDDLINGLEGNDIISGDRGQDTLNGGAGDDTYLWNLGDGFDTITDDSGNDTIKFGEGITLNDLTFAEGTNGCLEIYVKGDRSQGIRLNNQRDNGSTAQIEMLEFADGSTFDLINSSLPLVNFEGAYLNNTDENITVIEGSAGEDQITSQTITGVTIIAGGGNDYISCGDAADTYIYNIGDGLDNIQDSSSNNKLKFGPGINFADLTFRLGNSNQFMIFVDEALSQGVKCSSPEVIRYLEFADGSVIDLTSRNLAVLQGNSDDNVELNDGRINVINLGGGDDMFYNRVGTGVTISGGKGNDEIRGGTGKDTFIWNLGDGMDNLQETEAQDKIVFGAGITAADLTFRKEANGLRIIVNNDETQGMLIANYQPYFDTAFKNIYFADGSHLDISQELVLHQTNADDNLSCGSSNDTVYGGAGNDNIYTADGNDVLIGGTGNDILNGGAGDDIYVYNMGDGFDNISDEGGNDKIVLGSGIYQNDLVFHREDNNLKITMKNNENAGILLNNQFYENNKIETIEFHDGTTLDISNAEQLIQAMSTFSAIQGASDTALSNPTQDVSEMYSLAANSSLTNKAI